jgi:hypothetical protein
VRNKKKTSSRFWLISAALHGVALVVLILTPAGQRVFKQEERPLKPEIVRKDEALAEVIDEIRDLSVERLRAQVALLEAGRERMAVNFETMNRHYVPFVAGQIASARARLTQEGEKTLGRQEEILTAARRAVELKAAGSDPMWRDKHRAALIAGQEEIRRVLLLTAADDAELLATQNQAEAVQMEAFEALSVSVGAQNQLWNAEPRLETLSAEKTKFEEARADAERLLQAATAEVAKVQEAEKSAVVRQQAAQAAVGPLKQAVEKARKEKTGEAAAREALKTAEAAAKAAQQEAGKAKAERGQAARKFAAAKRHAEGRAKDLAKVADGQVKTAETVRVKTEERDVNAAKAAALQEQAQALQKTVYEKLLVKLEEQAKEAPKAAPESKETTS